MERNRHKHKQNKSIKLKVLVIMCSVKCVYSNVVWKLIVININVLKLPHQRPGACFNVHAQIVINMSDPLLLFLSNCSLGEGGWGGLYVSIKKKCYKLDND